LYRNDGSHAVFGLKWRLKQEKATEGWVLDIFDTKREAMREEQVISYKYGVPRAIFTVDTAGTLYDDSDLNYIFDNIPNLEGRALKILDDYGRKKEYPLCSKVDPELHKENYTSNATFRIRACNLVPEKMEMVVREPDNSIKYSALKEVNYIEGMHDFVSLKVDGYKTYVADNIATH